MRILTSVVFHLSIAFAIPWSILDKPDDVSIRNSAYVILAPRPDILDATRFCQYVYHKWWIAFLLLREAARQAALKLPPDPRNPTEYTHYGTNIEDVPVEAYNAETVAPNGRAGYKSQYYNCQFGCQDIRLAIEWVISRPIDIPHGLQLRARTIFSFPCPEGMVSRHREYPTMREVDPVSDTLAFELLKEKEYATKATEEGLHGASVPVLKGCYCRWPTPEDFEMARQAELFREARSRKTTKGLANLKNPEPVYMPKKSKLAKWGLSADEKPKWTDARPKRKRKSMATGKRKAATQLNPEEEENRAESSEQARIAAESNMQAQCHDYHYPEVNFDLNVVDPGATTSEHALSTEDENFMEYIRAVLSDFAGVTVPDTSFGIKPEPPKDYDSGS